MSNECSQMPVESLGNVHQREFRPLREHESHFSDVNLSHPTYESRVGISEVIIYTHVILLQRHIGNSHEIGIFQTLEMTKLKLSLYEIFLCESFQGVFQKIFLSFGPTHK